MRAGRFWRRFYRIGPAGAKCRDSVVRHVRLDYPRGRRVSPMSYVQSVLQPGETIRRIASIHWIIYLPGALCLLLACVTLIWGEFFSNQRMVWWQVVAGLLALFGLFLLIPEWFKWWTTEIAVTNHRIIYKTGFIRRLTKEMNMDKVESVEVDQSILGRMLDYGNIVIVGTGEGIEKLIKIERPIELRNSITGISSN
jgi:uncharacterized membrane protein YdbT with pleckstrin-like domain